VFTGIIRERGKVVAADRTADGEGLHLRIEAPATAGSTSLGDSVSVAGCCLTAVAVDDGRIDLEAVPETLSRTTLGRLSVGAEVNVEPALRVGDALGGHFVQGHVDGIGRVRSLEPEGDGVRLWLDLDPGLLRYCVEKGSLTADGVALTVATLDDRGVAIALVPHTLQETTLSTLEAGAEVNVEVDVLAKYAERLAPSR